MQTISSFLQHAISRAACVFSKVLKRNTGLALAGLILSLTAPLAFAQSAFFYRNLPGAYAGAGLTRTFVSPAARVFANVESNTVVVNVQEDAPSNGSAEFWQIRLTAPQGDRLSVGTYEGAISSFGTSPSLPILTINSSNNSCNFQAAGRFVVLDIAFLTDGSLSRLAANIYYDCGSVQAPRLVGEIRVNSAIPLTPSVVNADTSPDPFALLMQTPVDPGTTVTAVSTMAYGINAPTPISIVNGEYKINDGVFTSASGTVLNADLITVRAVASTTPGNTVTPSLTIGNITASTPIKTYQAGMKLSGLRLLSPPGDPVGAGTQRLYLSPVDLVRVTGDFQNSINASITDRRGQLANLRIGDPTNSALAVGTYENALRSSQGFYPTLEFIPSAGFGCNQASGRFVIRELVRDITGLVSLAVDFEQSCELNKPPLRGEFRFNSGVPFSSLPVDTRYGVEIKKLGRGSGTVAGLGGEISCGAACTTYLPQGWDLALGASATAPSVFRRFEGPGPCSGIGVCRFTVNFSEIVYARFELPTRLTVKSTGSGAGIISSSFGNLNCSTECSVDYDLDTVVPLAAFSNFGSVFAGWSGGGCSGNGACSVTMSAAKTVEANFVVGYRLTVLADQTYGTGRVTSVPAGIDCGQTCEAVVMPNDAVTLTAVANSGSTFAGWSGGGCSGVGTCRVVMNQSLQVRAIFSTPPRTITVSRAGTGEGVVTSTNGTISCGNVCSASFTPQLGIQLVAIPVQGSVFKGWTGTPCENAGVEACFVFQNSDIAVTAIFDRGPSAFRPVSDLNGDGKSDLLVQSPLGTTIAWLMEGTAIASATSISASDPSWTITHIADFNGDGKADLLWRNTNGSVALWLVNGSAVLSTTILLGPEPNWRVSHVADFNGDGKADILWRNDNGAVSQWLMNGSTATNAATLLGPNPDWRVSHIGDFNGDGKVDLLWLNTNGAVNVWLMNGSTVASAVAILGPTSDWSVSHLGDFNGDGKADILWRNTNGAVNLWLMNGGTVTAAAALLGANADWQVSHVGDFNADGKADILWRNNNGAVGLWLMNGGAATASAALLGPNADWRVSHILDLNGDGKSDLIWRNLNGAINAWLMDGATVNAAAGLAGPGNFRIVP